jgi:hypothetical protein
MIDPKFDQTSIFMEVGDPGKFLKTETAKSMYSGGAQPG